MNAPWHNDWRRLKQGVAESAPARPVSVVIPCYQAPDALELTIAGLERQDWPREMLEVVVVDDGSSPPLREPGDCPLDLRMVRQPRRGFGLARARNTGVRAAKHDILIFLDADIVAEAGLVTAHARWHQEVPDALTIGFCAYVCMSGIKAEEVLAHEGALDKLLASRPFDAPWLERHMARTADLTSRHEDLFRAVTGHNFAVSRQLFEYAGGFDESFTRYGGEDTEFAYRAQVCGGLLVPVREAFGWHRGRWMEGRASKDRDLRLQASKLCELIAEPGFRGGAHEHPFAVPRRIVTLEAGRASPGQVVKAVHALLADPAGDCLVRIELAEGREKEISRIQAQFPDRAAVRTATPGLSVLDAFPASPIHLRLPAGRNFPPGLIGRLEAALGDAAIAGNEEAGVSISRAWALHRARRNGGLPSDYGEARRLPAEPLYHRSHSVRNTRPIRGVRRRASQDVHMRHGMRAVLARIRAELRHVRGPRTTWRFLSWLGTAIRWRIMQGIARDARPARFQPATCLARVDAPLGVNIAAIGPRSQAVFQASSQVRTRLPGSNEALPDAVLVDGLAETGDVRVRRARIDEAPELAVPAFDPALDNPIGWLRDVESRVLALGPLDLLPPGSKARRTVSLDERNALRHCHHVEDTAAFHPNAYQRAGTLAQLAARGVLTRLADRDPRLERLLGTELGRLMQGDMAAVPGAERETLSIAMRRAALRTHSLAARARQVCRAAGAVMPVLPTVSVLLATCRPRLLRYAVASVARQSYPRLQLVLALHGPGFRKRSVDEALADFAHPVEVIRAGSELTLGGVLQRAAQAATGALFAKMDDDDAYGAEHLWDLVLAHQYSGATLLGKFPGVVYLAGSERTVRARWVPGETWSDSITGGTLLIAGADLKHLGGWRNRPRQVDRALIEDVLSSGGTVYRTHQEGYVLVRHGDRHTWQREDSEFLKGAETVHPGWPRNLPGMAGVWAPPVAENPTGCRQNPQRTGSQRIRSAGK